ncbi:MAG: polyribonucleotide nucleotidyltransferase [Ignavibacteriales bacterium]|nr:polyribonucleotide nucleotidyltransferase [Melioribacteraceae bacterium]RJP62819.1 MAG: polyribonucleotide nucleotidyltransferase [Ignavibacteriales bacterium]
MNVIRKEVEINGKKLILETGKLAKQADGSVMVRYGDTMVLVTAVAANEAKEDIDFFPLSVEYREKAYAAGKFPGGFFKREGRPTEKEILSSRLIDRPIRPLFPNEFKNETQLIANVYSFDGENDSDVLAAIGASAALHISRIPFLEPIGEVRVVRVEGQFIVNPTIKQTEASDLELTVAGTADSIMMVEGEAKEISEEEFLSALRFAHEEIKKIVQLQHELREACGVEKMTVTTKVYADGLEEDVKKLAYDKYAEVVAMSLEKEERATKNKEINEFVLAELAEKYPEFEKDIKQILHDIEKELMRKQILENKPRLDGRSLTDVRQIWIDLGLLPRTHGSALFTRGETQSLMTLTLGTKGDEQIVDGLQEEYKKRFLLHYNFPPFSVGEVGRMTGVGRREIGHGNLAERSLKFIIPDEATFPYIIRLNSDILESNGSSSMATVCSGTLAMLDGGVPIKTMIAGIAMGLVKEGDSYAVLSDILGNEDHLGDMDFKVAGSEKGITAIQMDIKIQGISFEIMEKALHQAKEGRMHILSIMKESISEPRAAISQYAPTLLFTKINPEKIGSVIGPGGKVIQGIQREYTVDIAIEEDGTVHISGQDKVKAEAAREYIKKLTQEPEIGKTYEAKVIKLQDYGAFVEFLPNIQGLLHISQLDTKRIEKVESVLKEGDKIKVKLIKIENGKFSLSRKALMIDEKKDENVPEESN